MIPNHLNSTDSALELWAVTPRQVRAPETADRASPLASAPLDGSELSTVPAPEGEVEFNPVEWCSLDDADWCSQVDFVCDAGSRPVDGSTVYDLSAIADGEEPELLREGLGELIAA